MQHPSPSRTLSALLLAALATGCPKQNAPAEDEPGAYVRIGPTDPAVCVSYVHAAGKPKGGGSPWMAAVDAMENADLDAAAAALAEAPEHPSTTAALGVLAMLQGETTPAREALRDLSLAWPDDPCLQQSAAVAALLDRRVDFARAHLDDALRLAPDDPEIAFLSAQFQLFDGDRDQASRTLRRVLQADPDHSAAAATLGTLYLLSGDALLAIPQLEKARAAGIEVTDALALAYYDADRTAEYVDLAADLGLPLGDQGAVGAADGPEAAFAAFKQVIGVGPQGKLFADLQTSQGPITCELFWDKAPVTVGNWVGLAKGTQPWIHPTTGEVQSGPLYPGTVFHRVIPDFMIQGGDPIGQGSGNPGYRFHDEIHPSLSFDVPGRLAMANAGPGTNGSQWFITDAATQHLTGRHTIFGQCDTASLQVVANIARVETAAMDKPLVPVTLDSITLRGE